ncbi:flavonoid 3'-monooxygenase-like [Sesamum indicum]|uniref:Flavonoid 3'-monooxygenase-like n=1 Tax=Sesamum indicum TaxID=4182 RepID=A0A6I9SM57_SESIN|nr:flavonoid 3'-monooxygenase-like [Sesamum indicum]
MISLSDSSSLSAPLLILISLPILWCLFILFTKSGNKTAPTPPGPWGLPIVGFLPFLRPDMHIQFNELARQYGPIYRLRLGTKLCTVISSPSLIKEIVRDHDTIFANRDGTVAGRIGSYNGNDIAFCPYDSSWRMRRKLFVHDMLSNRSLDATFNLRKDEVRKAIRNIYTKINTPVKILELASGISLNAMMNMVWGSTIEGERKDKIGAAVTPLVVRSVDLLGVLNVSDYVPALARFDIQGVEKEMSNLTQRFGEIVEDIINERTKISSGKVGGGGNKNGGRVDLLQMLMEFSEKQDVKTEFGKTQIKAMVTNIILGGIDTLAATIEWAMDEFMRNPKVMEKAYNELNEVVGLNNLVEEFHISKLVYLEAVIKETLRKHPVGSLLPRISSQSCIVGGYSIPKDSTVILNIWSTQRDPLAWDNPLEFMPERFLDNSAKWNFSGNNFNYIPFGSGRRICAGIPLAERMLRYVLASLLHSFDWQLPKGEIMDRQEIFGMVTKRKTPLVAIPSPRLFDKNLYV